MRMCLIATVAAAATLSLWLQPLVAAPVLAQRIASINLCADQLLLELADPARIAGVSTLAGDPALSFLASKAAPYRKLRGNAEQLFRLKADLVLTGSFDRPYARSILQRRGVKYKAVEPWTNIAQGRQQISTFAAQLGVPEKGAELIRRIDAALEKLRASAKSIPPATVLVLHRRGYILHTGILRELVDLSGLKDASSRLRLGASGVASLEEIVRLRPDFLIVESLADRPEDQGEAKLAHPALLRLYPPAKRLILASRLGLCAGPATPALVRRLHDEIAAKVR